MKNSMDKEQVLTIAEYEKDVQRTAKEFKSVADAVQWAVNGLNAEAGEVAGLLQKVEQGHEITDDMLNEEVGDAAYFVAFLAYFVNRDGLEGLLRDNIAKRRHRYPNGFSAKDSIERRDLERLKDTSR